MKKIKNEIVRRGLAFAIAFTMAATAVPFAGDTAYGATATTGVKTVESKLSEDAADYICGVYGETTAALNLRVGPGTGYESVHVTQKGDKLTLKGYEYVSGIKWYKTEYSGKTVYCSGEYVELVTTDFAENRVGKVISGTYLKKNLCEEEGNVTYLQEGVFFDLITRYETENGYWYEISVDGMTGFVKGEDVNTNPLIEAVTFDFIIYAKSEDGMELREGSSTSYDIVYTLEEGVSLELTGYRDTGKGLWYRCEYNGQTLYASADEIDITDYQYEDRLGKALENMNVYYRPTSQSDVVATVPKGEYFDLYIRINTSAGYMYMLEYNGITGYAYGDQISSNPVMDTIEFTSPVYAKTTDDLNMREGASTQYEIVAVAPKGSEITLLYQIEKGSGNWYKCIYAGKTVYCNAEYVEFITTVYADYRLGMIKNDTYLKENVGNDFDNVKLVEKDTVVKLINRYETTDGYWHEVSVDGVTGCVPAEVINTNPRIETVNFTNKIYGKTIKEANLMAGPNTTYDVVFTVKKGTALTVTGYILTGKGMYYTCKYSGKTVYVHENYATWDYTTYNEGRFGKAASKITFYKGVGTATEKYGTIASGEIFDLYSKIKSDEGYFYKIKYDGNIGYVVADDSVNENPLIDSYSLSSGTYCKTTAKVVIRSKSSSKGSAVATVSKGTSLIAVARIEKSAGDWYKVKYGSKIGYLQEEYLNLVEKTYSPENLASSQKAISVREGVGTNYDVIFTIPQSAPVKISQRFKTEDGYWYRVYYNGQYGYAPASNIKLGEYGIDVSVHNGIIDWDKVKDSGIEYAFIRTSYTGYGTGQILADANYKRNIEGALAAGIKVGVYHYSQAITLEEAREEVEFMCNLIKPYKDKITLPVVCDTESTGNNGRADKLSKSQRTKIVKEFCETVEDNGYDAMIYSNLLWLYNSLDMSQLDDYQVWVAQYYTQCNYTGDYSYWQYTSSGTVPGISGRVDMNMKV